MEATELMLEDWVLHNGKPKQINVIWGHWKVSVNDPDKIVSSIYTDKCLTNDITPIPLDDEILVKNGFDRLEDFWGIVIEHTYIELHPTKGNIAVWMDWENTEVYADFILPYPKFVHELQHTLRLCGIKKEIII